MNSLEPVALGRLVGLAWLSTLVIGILASALLGQGIDINLSADVEAVATAMLEALQNPTPVDVLQRRASEFTASHSARRYMEVLTGSNSI